MLKGGRLGECSGGLVQGSFYVGMVDPSDAFGDRLRVVLGRTPVPLVPTYRQLLSNPSTISGIEVYALGQRSGVP